MKKTKLIVWWTICLVLVASGCHEKDVYEGKPVEDTPLKEFVELSKDSTYLVFAFIRTCHYCQNSVVNLNEYEQAGIADKVIGLTLRDSAGNRSFIENYRPAFAIVECEPLGFLKFTNRFPTAYYIKDNTIKKVYRGELPESKKFGKKIKHDVGVANPTCGVNSAN